MKKSKKIGLGLLGLVVVLVVLPFLIPMDTYLRQAESIASEKLGEPVTITSAKLFFLPSPRVSLSGIAVGKDLDVAVNKIVVVPTVATLFSSQRVIDLKLDQVVVKQSALKIYERLSNAKSDGAAPPVALRQLSIEGLSLDWPDTKLPMTNVYVALKEGGLDSAKIDSLDGKVTALLAPKDGGHHILLNVKRWELPIKSKLMVDSGEFDMMLKGSRLNVTQYKMGLYGGAVTGGALLTWAKDWQLSGDVNVKHLSLKAPSQQVSPRTYMSGSLDGSGRFSSKAKGAGQLADHLLANFEFVVNNGVLHGLDLVKAASLLVKQDATGGQTQFDKFSGKLGIVGKQYKLSNLDISSGLLSAKGHVTVTPKSELDGMIDVAVKKSVGLVEVPLVVAGTTASPLVYPSKAAIAGAAVGTAILGPGVGTSLGIKASKGLDKIKGLFGGDD
jgi:uncharacterized protein involved in outer membrane biogenesis